ncbi:MAG: VOC family protein [Verrucomicrobia bacterium]|nr:VOC family protein [Verrucomicrobiota bacterium]
MEALFDRLRSKYPAIGWVKRPPNCPYPGYFSHDPAGSIFALSEKDNADGDAPEARPKTVNFARWSKGNPEDRYLHHYAIRTRKLDECARFYEDVFGFTHQMGAAGDPNHYLSDGRLTLMLLPWSIQDYGGISVTGRGPDHIGFMVEDAKIVQSEIEEFFSHFSPGQAPLWLLENTNKSSDESRIRADMIRNSCPISEYEFTDKDGVFVVIGDKTFADLMKG